MKVGIDHFLHCSITTVLHAQAFPLSKTFFPTLPPHLGMQVHEPHSAACQLGGQGWGDKQKVPHIATPRHTPTPTHTLQHQTADFQVF